MHRRAWRQILGQRSPLASRAQDVHHPVDDLAHIDMTPVAAPLGRRDQRADQRPLVIRQVARIAQFVPVVAPTVVLRPHRRPPHIQAASLESQPTPQNQHVRGQTLSAAQLQALLEGLDWERRETDERQRVQVPYDEGVANHIGPESCAGGREAEREALTGVRVGQPLSGVRLPIRSANALQSAEGNTSRRVIASAGRLRVVVRPWHARTSLTREPRDLWFAPAGRAVGRTVKAGGRRP
jgi:hypothetical protein